MQQAMMTAEPSHRLLGERHGQYEGEGEHPSGGEPFGKNAARVRRLEKMTADYWRMVTRTGGAYIPPRRLAEQPQELPERSTEAYQRLSWDALRRSLNGLINKVNASNIKEIVRELFQENLIRGRGLFTRALLKAQAGSIIYTPVYAALVAVINSKFPEVGGLVVRRIISQFRRAYRRNDKTQCVAMTSFMAHLVNQRVLHELCVLQALMLLLDRPTDDSVEIAVNLMRECGATLSEHSPKPANAVFERFRAILHEGIIDKRVQYMIEVLFQVRKESFKNHIAIPPELDLLDEEDKAVHNLMLDDELDVEEGTNVFKHDPDFVEHEEEYESLRREILGDTDEEEGEGEQDEDEKAQEKLAGATSTITIKDQTDTNLINFRKIVYLTIMSSVDFEECGHKLLKVALPEGFEIELCHMIVECCSNEKTYLKFYGLLAERFCKLNPTWQENFEKCFGEVYATVHRLETNRIRNVAKLFGHLLESDAISWAVMECVRLNENDTTSASRILIKFLLQELAEFYGIPKMMERFENAAFEQYFKGLFPTDDPRDVRFCINFLTAIGLAAATDRLRQRLQEMMPSGMDTVTSATPLELAPQPYNFYQSPLSAGQGEGAEEEEERKEEEKEREDGEHETRRDYGRGREMERDWSYGHERDQKSQSHDRERDQRASPRQDRRRGQSPDRHQDRDYKYRSRAHRKSRSPSPLSYHRSQHFRNTHRSRSPRRHHHHHRDH